MEPDPAVTDYLGGVPEPDRTTFEAWRGLCRRLPPGFTEELRCGMPCYVRDGVTELAFARQKR